MTANIIIISSDMYNLLSYNKNTFRIIIDKHLNSKSFLKLKGVM